MSEKQPLKAKEIFRKIEKLTEANPEFKQEAFGFIMAGLNFTMTRLKKKRHISGQELAKGIRDFSFKQFGPMAQTVLEYWGIQSTHDIGRVVFALVEEGLLFKNDEDKLSDFDDVYDFEASLKRGYWKELRKKFKFQPILKTKQNPDK
jgi:uncharacterized repeat protein (TIGR04138 family)